MNNSDRIYGIILLLIITVVIGLIVYFTMAKNEYQMKHCVSDTQRQVLICETL